MAPISGLFTTVTPAASFNVGRSFALRPVKIALFYSDLRDEYDQVVTWEEGDFEQLFRVYLWDESYFTTVNESDIIGGALSPSTSPRRAPVFNPATGEQTAELPLSTAAELDAAVAAAKLALPEWADTTPLKRARVMFRFVDLVNAEFSFGLADFSDQFLLHFDQRLACVKGEQQGVDHLLFGDFVR